MLVDSDVLIWCLRGNTKAASAVEKEDQRKISVITRMELMQGCRDRKEHRLLRRFLMDYEIEVIDLSSEIGHRADTWMEEFHLSDGVEVADCLIAASAVVQAEPLLTANVSYFRCFSSLEIQPFVP